MKLPDHGVFLCGGVPQQTAPLSPAEGRKRTMAYRILQAHNQSGDEQNLRIRFDAMLSHDITYVGIIQQARASGMKEFPIPYALTNCHNSLCAVGGTIMRTTMSSACLRQRNTAAFTSRPTRASFIPMRASRWLPAAR